MKVIDQRRLCEQ